MTIAEITQALSRHARAAADLARWCTAHARAEDDQRDAEEQARRAGVHADKARAYFEACRALDPECVDARIALLAASEASKSYMEARIVCAVRGSKAGRVREVKAS